MKSDSASSTASPTATPTATPGPLTITVTAEVEADETAGVYYVTSIPNYMFEDDVHAGRTFVQRAEEKAEPFDFSFILLVPTRSILSRVSFGAAASV